MFQHFRLGELAMHNPLPPHLMQGGGSTMPSGQQTQFSGQTTFVNNPPHIISSSSGPKAPYGSGDSDDGYTLVFPTLEAFNEWREKEEETNVVEFVKGDTHGSKAVPPRFKDHTKLVCARHSRSGRKKYVKKHPERMRKIPSRKLEGIGCPASISYKTYYDTEQVRVCYNSQHSHEIGPANLPFTRRGRKAALAQDKGARAKTAKPEEAGPSASAPQHFSSAVGMLAPLPGAPPGFPQPGPYGYPPPPPQFAMAPPGAGGTMGQERWDNMAVLFQFVREQARNFEYPFVSAAALETCLIRLYLESPPAAAAQAMPNLQFQQPPPPPAPQPQPGQPVQANNTHANPGPAADSDSEASGEEESS